MTAKTEPPNTVDRRAIWAYAYIHMYMDVYVCVYYIHDDNNKSNNNDSDSIIHYQNVPFNECLLLN